MSATLNEQKPMIRSILLSLGRQANEREFRTAYYNVDGQPFNDILQGEIIFNFFVFNLFNWPGLFFGQCSECQMTFWQFMKAIPDVCRIWKNSEGDTVIERVSSDETSHMDHLTVVKKKKKLVPRFRYGYFLSVRSNKQFFLLTGPMRLHIVICLISLLVSDNPVVNQIACFQKLHLRRQVQLQCL